MPPIRHKNTDLSRDERFRCKVLHDAGFTIDQIVEQTGATWRQVQYATTHTTTPRRRSGRPPILTESQIEELIDFIRASRENRRMPYRKVAQLMDFGVSEHVIRTALESRGFHRRIAMRKPPISETNRQRRLNWAIEHKDWTQEQWYNILWTDETWITPGRHTRTWVTRQPGEEWDDTCIIEREQRKKGWMFWGCFHGITPGPSLFWEKDWGTINAASYQAHIIPLIHGYMTLNPTLILMQDGAPGHSAKDTYQDLKERGITPIFWPPYSPDLNPIERIWHYMKNYIQENYLEKMSYDQLRIAVTKAWEVVGAVELMELIKSMGERCQAVIEAEGRFTKY